MPFQFARRFVVVTRQSQKVARDHQNGVVPTGVLIRGNPAARKQAERLLRRWPAMQGAPVHVRFVAGLRDRHGPVHAGSLLRQRRILFDCSGREFPRILTHELFHFAWLRAGNSLRWSFEALVAEEWRAGARGELGWSAEWRKARLTAADLRRRSGRWREYCCESFCDTAAWLYSGVGRHEEYTLAARFRRSRAAWFHQEIESRVISI